MEMRKAGVFKSGLFSLRSLFSSGLVRVARTPIGNRLEHDYLASIDSYQCNPLAERVS